MFQYCRKFSDRPSQPTTTSSNPTSEQLCRPTIYSIPWRV